jgi:hypothetical protein
VMPGICNAASWSLTPLGINVLTPFGLVPTAGVTEALQRRIHAFWDAKLYRWLTGRMQESQSFETSGINQPTTSH